jgi:hypothetical protein
MQGTHAKILSQAQERAMLGYTQQSYSCCAGHEHKCCAYPMVTRMVKKRLCRKIAFSRQNPKIVYRKINDLRDQTFLFSVICDRALCCALHNFWVRLTPW